MAARVTIVENEEETRVVLSEDIGDVVLARQAGSSPAAQRAALRLAAKTLMRLADQCDRQAKVT